jgi:hypothetical protein
MIMEFVHRYESMNYNTPRVVAALVHVYNYRSLIQDFLENNNPVPQRDKPLRLYGIDVYSTYDMAQGQVNIIPKSA